MPTLDHYAAFVISAFVITCLLLGGYGLYLWSRFSGLRRRLAEETAEQASLAQDTPASAQPAPSPSQL